MITYFGEFGNVANLPLSRMKVILKSLEIRKSLTSPKYVLLDL
jgi:hypothetical protein